ncbi:hypothetical protein [Streptomyces sp. 4F14]|uniref:hypothetical protein n=1 Tax=Streptomyces sp. 4F14 TaxID=3394380 RepID=UPI003A85F0A1
MNTLVRVGRHLTHTPGAPARLPVPDGMTVPLGCDAVAVPARLGPLLMPRLPRVGCVYADETHWWWLVPADSDYAVEWPAPAQYVTGAVLPDAPHALTLINRPTGTVPYTPPIPLYLALCRLTGATPTWSRPISA